MNVDYKSLISDFEKGKITLKDFPKKVLINILELAVQKIDAYQHAVELTMSEDEFLQI